MHFLEKLNCRSEGRVEVTSHDLVY